MMAEFNPGAFCDSPVIAATSNLFFFEVRLFPTKPFPTYCLQHTES